MVFNNDDKKEKFLNEYLMFNEVDKNAMLFFLFLMEACAYEQYFDIYSYMKGVRFKAMCEIEDKKGNAIG